VPTKLKKESRTPSKRYPSRSLPAKKRSTNEDLVNDSPYSPSESPIDAIPVTIENGEEDAPNESVDDSYLDSDDFENLQKTAEEETKKRKAKDTPRKPKPKRARKESAEPKVSERETPDPDSKVEQTSKAEQTSTVETQPTPEPESNLLTSKLSVICTELVKQLAVSSQEQFENFGVKEWLSFDHGKFITEVVKTARDSSGVSIIAKTESVPKKEKTGEIENFFNFL